MELTYGCNTSCEEFKDRERPGAKVVMGGLITAANTKMSRKGTEFSIIEIEDFSGKAEIRLFGRNHSMHHDKFHVGEPVVVRLSYTPGRFDPNRADLNIDEVAPLDSIKGKMANAVKVWMDFKFKNKDFFARLGQLEDKSRPGSLIIELTDNDSGQTMRVKSRKKVPVTRELVNIIEESGLRFKVIDES